MHPIRWSYSKLSTYEKCPAMWKYRYIDKLSDPPTPAMQRGTRLHRLCEAYLKREATDIAPELEPIAPILQRLLANQATSEKLWRFDADWQAIDEGGWLKGIVDVHFVLDDVLHIYDFKSGNSYPSHSQQLELYSVMGVIQYPEVREVQHGAIYIDTGKLNRRKTIPREELERARIGWHKRAEKMMQDEELLPTPGSACYRCNFKDSDGGPCSAWRTR